MQGLYPKIVNSDIIIFGTPVSWDGPTRVVFQNQMFLDIASEKNASSLVGRGTFRAIGRTTSPHL